MTIAPQHVVALSYELWVDDGENGKTFKEKSDEGQPLVFLFGTGTLLPKFEDAILGLSKGDGKEFMLPFEDGYGDYDEEMIVPIPRSVFTADKEQTVVPIVGKVIPMRDGQGNLMQGTVVKLEKEHVVMDFNHPMAGYDLFFKVQILDVRVATAEEIAHGHVHGPGGHQH
jgi:FKBP-type peptidyl-prolyl cis-trans isomerase SlyD